MTISDTSAAVTNDMFVLSEGILLVILFQPAGMLMSRLAGWVVKLFPKPQAA